MSLVVLASTVAAAVLWLQVGPRLRPALTLRWLVYVSLDTTHASASAASWKGLAGAWCIDVHVWRICHAFFWLGAGWHLEQEEIIVVTDG